MLPVPGPALQKVLLLWGDTDQSSNYHSHIPEGQGGRVGQPSDCSVPGKVLIQMLQAVQEKQ